MEVKSLRELAKKALPPMPTHRYGEPMPNPAFTDMLDQIQEKVDTLEGMVGGRGDKLKDYQVIVRLTVFRMCEAARDLKLNFWPPDYTPVADLRRAVEVLRRAVSAIKSAQSEDELVGTWCNHINERANDYDRALQQRE